MTKNSDDKRNSYLGVGIALGVAIGAAFGIAVDNLAMGIGLGIALGIAIPGAMADRRATKTGELAQDVQNRDDSAGSGS
jgi:hypothetical protein